MRLCVLGNGSLYLGFDQSCCLRELFWPVVGLANHVAESRENRFLLWYQGQFFYMGGEDWEVSGRYGTGMSFEWSLEHPALPFFVEMVDAVDPGRPLWQRRIAFKEADTRLLDGMTYEFGLYSKQYYNLGENDTGEAAFWDPKRTRLYHYKGPIWVAIDFRWMRSHPIETSTAYVAKRRDGGVKLVPETGGIEGRVVDHGLIESMIGFRHRPETERFGSGMGEFVYTLAFGSNREEADANLDAAVFENVASIDTRGRGSFRNPSDQRNPGDACRQHYRDSDSLTCESISHDDAGTPEVYEKLNVEEKSARYWYIRLAPSGSLSRDKRPAARHVSLRELYETSVKVLATHCDRYGGILASCDDDILGDYRDHYRYVWPRDAAMCASALCQAGFPEFGRRYLTFCVRALSKGGFFWQRYRPDGTRGSGWHPYNLPEDQIPFQEDETALSIVTARDYLRKTHDLDFVRGIYSSFIQKAARFIMEYTDNGGMLVKPSFDLWEERRGVFTFTQASCVAALYAAAEIGWALGEGEVSRFLRSGMLLHEGLLRFLSDDETGFYRGLQEPGRWRDTTPDASLSLVPVLLFRCPVEERWQKGGSYSSHIAALVEEAIRRSAVTWERLGDRLGVAFPQRGLRGIARYDGDWYFRPPGSGSIPGNPWFITTAWHLKAGYLLGLLDHWRSGDRDGDKASGEGSSSRPEDSREKDEGLKRSLRQGMRFFAEFSLETGILSEQVNALTGEPLSVAPLAWSHAAYIDLWTLLGR